MPYFASKPLPILRTATIPVVIAVVLFGVTCVMGDPQEISYGKAEKLCDLNFDIVKESSGLAVSRVRPGVFWTHNDSGDKPRLYAFDETGRAVGTYNISNASARDWEDMASMELDGKPYLIIGDVGDNGRKRTEYQLYVVAEEFTKPSTPNDAHRTNRLASLSVERMVRYRYDSGPQDCESVAFDPDLRQVIFVTKNWSLTADVYVMDWNPVESEPATSTKIHTAKRIGRIRVPGATAMDISPDGRRAVVLCYGNAYQYVRGADETWETAFARPSREIKMPERKQGETICFGADGRTIFLTSEHLPTPLFRVSVVHADN